MQVCILNNCYKILQSIIVNNFSEVETVDEDDDDLNSITRSKRDADSYDYMITPTRTRCPLLLVADYRFFREMGGGDTKTTINYLVCFFKEFDFTNNYL